MTDLETCDFGGFWSHIYKQQCANCHIIHEVSTQPDDSPEYYTDIYIKCRCGNSVKFTIPVN